MSDKSNSLDFLNIPQINTLKLGKKIDEKQYGLPITVDGINAHIFEAYQSEDGFEKSKERIVIIFEKKHPKYGKEFYTKYYKIDKNGNLKWGTGNPIMKIEYHK